MSLPHQIQEISPMEGQQYIDNQTAGYQHIKRRKLKSGVWNYFKKYRNEDGKDCAKCNICGKDFDGSSTKGTTHLRNHFNSCQRKRNGGGGGGGDKPAEAGNITNPIIIKEKSGMVEQLNYKLYMEAVVKELPEHQRSDAVSSMEYEANARVRDPVYGCAGAISSLQLQIETLQAQLAAARVEIIHMILRQSESCCDVEEEEEQKAEENRVMVCKGCNSGDSCMLFLPCRHLCSCKACDAFLDSCPVCLAPKMASLEVLTS